MNPNNDTRTDEQLWNEVLDVLHDNRRELTDKEVRELLEVKREERKVKNKITFNAQCSTFNAQCPMFNAQRSTFNVQRSMFNVQRSMLNVQRSMKFAAAVLLSGLAIASYHILSPKTRHQQAEETAPSLQVRAVGGSADSLVVFDNVPLEEMLPEIAAYYNAEVEFRDEAARRLRFHFVWRREDGLDHAIEKLNRFESLTVRHEADKVIVE